MLKMLTGGGQLKWHIGEGMLCSIARIGSSSGVQGMMVALVTASFIRRSIRSSHRWQNSYYTCMLFRSCSMDGQIDIPVLFVLVPATTINQYDLINQLRKDKIPQSGSAIKKLFYCLRYLHDFLIQFPFCFSSFFSYTEKTQ